MQPGIVFGVLTVLSLLAACSAQAGKNELSSCGVKRLGAITFSVEGEDKSYSTIAGKVRGEPRSSASYREQTMRRTISLDGYERDDFGIDKISIEIFYAVVSTEPDFARPTRVSIDYRPDGVLEPFWRGRNVKLAVESIEPEGKGAHVKATFTAELCYKASNSAPIDEATCHSTEGAIDTRLLTPEKRITLRQPRREHDMRIMALSGQCAGDSEKGRVVFTSSISSVKGGLSGRRSILYSAAAGSVRATGS